MKQLMDNIIEPNESFDFTKLSLAHPSGIQGGAYFTKFLYNNKPLYIQTTKGQTKQGFVKSGKKYYCDLMYDNNASSLINWFEQLEGVCQTLLYAKNDAWFQSSLEKSDIEDAFSPTIRVYKSGKFYLVRTNVPNNASTNEPSVKVYSESETPLAVSDVKGESRIISILEIQGIKFTSRNFQIEIELKQIMVLDDEPTFDNFLFKSSKKQQLEPLAKQEFSDENDKIDIPMIVNEPTTTVGEQPTSDEPTTTVGEPTNVEEPTNVNDPTTGEDEAIGFDIEELDIDTEFKEIDEIKVENDLETITLKKPNEVYFELYREARNKAKQAKRAAIIAYLEAKNIKKTYLLDDLNDSDSDFDAEIEDVSESELDGL
jgi:hypothetical protein